MGWFSKSRHGVIASQDKCALAKVHLAVISKSLITGIMAFRWSLSGKSSLESLATQKRSLLLLPKLKNCEPTKYGNTFLTKMGEQPSDACLYPEERPDALSTADCVK
jgi:hypothetical protein